MRIHTFRMYFIGLGLAVFGAVLGMLFQFRPQVISVSPLFLQLLAYMLGKFFENALPKPGSRLHGGGAFWNFMNPGPFNHGQHGCHRGFRLLRVCVGRPLLRHHCQRMFYFSHVLTSAKLIPS
jgi:hypothetical protein